MRKPIAAVRPAKRPARKKAIRTTGRKAKMKAKELNNIPPAGLPWFVRDGYNMVARKRHPSLTIGNIREKTKFRQPELRLAKIESCPQWLSRGRPFSWATR